MPLRTTSEPMCSLHRALLSLSKGGNENKSNFLFSSTTPGLQALIMKVCGVALLPGTTSFTTPGK